MASHYFVIILVASIFYSISDIEAARHGPSPPPTSVANGESLVDFPSGPTAFKQEDSSTTSSNTGVSDCHLGDGEPMDVDNDPMDVDGYIEAKASPDPIPAPINYEEPLSSSKVLPEVGLDTIPAPINYKEPPPSSKVLPEASPDPIPVPVHNEEPKPPPSGNVLLEVGPNPIPALVNNKESKPLPSGNVLPKAGPDPIPAPINYEEPPPGPRA